MRQLQFFLASAARSLSTGAASHVRDARLLYSARAAAAPCTGRAWGDLKESPLSAPLGIASYATEQPPGTDPPPHSGEREQSAADAKADIQHLAENMDARNTLNATGADSIGPESADAVSPNATAAYPQDDAQAEIAEVQAKLEALGFEEDDRDDPDASHLGSLASISDSEAEGSSSDDSDLEEELLGASDDDAEDILLRKAARLENKGSTPASQQDGQGGLSTISRQLTLLEEIQQSSKKRQRFLLQQALSGKGDTESRLADELKPPETGDFSMKIVDVNRTSKGARQGRIAGYSALVVVGNQNGILGQGSGKSLEAKAAVDKATRKALKHLTYVPRFRGHTIYYPITVLYGKTKLILYPLSSGRGIRASNMMTSLCQLAGLKDIGIKIQGSRNLRNSVQALFKAFEQMQTRVDEDSVDITLAPMPQREMREPVLDLPGFCVTAQMLNLSS